ncbi:MAG: glutamate 5-kinase [Kiritimatiellia bacterium]
MKVVVKIGSNVLTRPDGRLSIARIAALVDEVDLLKSAGHDVLIVTSGAVAAGRAQTTLPKDADRVVRRQVLSAVGQAILIDTYRALFDTVGRTVGQILVTKSDFSTAEHASNMRQCLCALWSYGIIPVVNENDTVSVESLMFTDNDELAGLLASLLHADLLVILSSIDGLYDGDPEQPNARLIRNVSPEDDFSALVSQTKSSQGRGGMNTKLAVAKRSAEQGIPCVIANGTRPHVLCALVNGDAIPCTRFTVPVQS